MEWQYFVGDCSDPAVQQQAKENFIKGFNEVFAPGDSNYCQREQICTLENIKITCGKVQRRKRRNAQVSKLFLYRQFEPLKNIHYNTIHNTHRHLFSCLWVRFFFSESKRPVEILKGKLWPWYGSFAEATATIKSRCVYWFECFYDLFLHHGISYRIGLSV